MHVEPLYIQRFSKIIVKKTPETFIVQDKLFRVWGKLLLEREDAIGYYGKFEPMPDFNYLRGKFEEYAGLVTSGFGNVERINELNKWIVDLRPQLVSADGQELELLGVQIRSLEQTSELVFHGTKLSDEDQSLRNYFEVAKPR